MTDPAAPTSDTGRISINDKLLAAFLAGTDSGMSSGGSTLNDQTLRAAKTTSKLAHSVFSQQEGNEGVSAAMDNYTYTGGALGRVPMYTLPC
ncbi:hypothetical protein FRC10_001948 [Ceratobasidium sp. 414]|nr:hypothetical protein FRC10_001948 [Ceratobasidium sp. 414]